MLQAEISAATIAARPQRGTISGWSSRIASASAIEPFSTTNVPSI